MLEKLREVPRGQTVSYGELAARAGNPRPPRAVGTACARNPIPIVVPCHRVLPGTGRLGNYGGGPERKRALLELEGRSYDSSTVTDLMTTWAAGWPVFGSAWMAPILSTTSMPAGDLAQQRVVGRQRRGAVAGDDEELRAGRARPARSPVLAIATMPFVYLRSLGGASSTRVAGAARAVAGRVAALDHEVRRRSGGTSVPSKNFWSARYLNEPPVIGARLASSVISKSPQVVETVAT